MMFCIMLDILLHSEGNGKLTYKKPMRVEGLPEGIVFKRIGSYGRKQLVAIMENCDQIEIFGM